MAIDDFNFKKRPMHSPRRHPRMDGFVSPESFNRASTIAFPEKSSEAEKTETKSLDNFTKNDGYHSSAQPIVSVSSLPAPLLNAAQRKRGLFHRRPKGRRLSTGIKKRRPWVRNVKRVMLALGVIVLVVGGYFGIKIYIVEHHVLRGGGSAPALAANVDISQLRGEGDGRINILMLGIGGPGHDGPDLTDTMLLVSIDPVNNQAALLSIPRDLWVEIPGYGEQKINAAFSYGKQDSKAKIEAAKTEDGIKLADSTLSKIIGIPIHYHVVVDFTAFKQTVDAVGGVTFNVPEQLYDPTIAWENHGKSVIAAKGTQTFDGARALLYARSRETSTDFARSQRQRQIIVALKDKVLSVGTFSNPLKISGLLSSFGDNIYTDFGSGDLPRLYQIGQQIPTSSIFSLDLITAPHDFLTTGTSSNGLSIVLPKAGFFQYADVQNYVRNALKDGFIQQENASIAILNGTTSVGLASQESKLLKSYGYNVTTVSDAPTTNYQHTQLIALHGTSKKYTQHYLEQRLKVSATTTAPVGIVPGTADFVIILGSDTSTTAQP
jgi:LCP family protein required for cell wall assembly